jgi:hypothetical protein
MVELADERGLDHEAGLGHDVVGLLEDARIEHLDRDVDVAERIERLEDVARGPASQPSLDRELAEALGAGDFRDVHAPILVAHPSAVMGGLSYAGIGRGR